MLIDRIAFEVLEGLSDYKPEIYYRSKHDSIYIRINGADDKDHSLEIRIGDHPKTDRYSYKWEIRTDIEGFNRDGYKYIFGWDKIYLFITSFVLVNHNYLMRIKQKETARMEITRIGLSAINKILEIKNDNKEQKKHDERRNSKKDSRDFFNLKDRKASVEFYG